jgi:hypothetical protein
MRMSKTHKVVVSAVVTTIAAATVLTFTRGNIASADDIASLPQASNDSPVVAGRTPGATTKPTPTETSPSPKATDPATQAPKPVATTSSSKPSTSTTKPPAPTTEPAPSPTPTPTPHKSLLDILLGK